MQSRFKGQSLTCNLFWSATSFWSCSFQYYLLSNFMPMTHIPEIGTKTGATDMQFATKFFRFLVTNTTMLYFHAGLCYQFMVPVFFGTCVIGITFHFHQPGLASIYQTNPHTWYIYFAFQILDGIGKCININVSALFNQLTSKADGGITGSRLRWSILT